MLREYSTDVQYVKEKCHGVWLCKVKPNANAAKSERPIFLSHRQFALVVILRHNRNRQRTAKTMGQEEVGVAVLGKIQAWVRWRVVNPLSSKVK